MSQYVYLPRHFDHARQSLFHFQNRHHRSVFVAFLSHAFFSPPATLFIRAFTASISASCPVSFLLIASAASSSVVPSTTYFRTMIRFASPCLYTLAFACWYSSKLQIWSNQIKV